jgi:hypothetical protein
LYVGWNVLYALERRDRESLKEGGHLVNPDVDGRILLTFRHRASSIQDRHFATLQRTLFIYIKKQIYFIIGYLLDGSSLI